MIVNCNRDDRGVMDRFLTDKAFLEKLIIDKGGIVRTADLEKAGYDYRRVQRLLEECFLKKIKNGCYALYRDGKSDDERIRILFPEGILTMASALYVYGFIRERPSEYYIAIDKNVSRSRFKLEAPRVVPYYVEKSALDYGITSTAFGGGEMNIYTRERLLCEVLKYEKKFDRSTVDKIVDKFVDNYHSDKHTDMMELMECAVRRQVKSKVQTRLGDRI